jgi:hypothetical protein
MTGTRQQTAESWSKTSHWSEIWETVASDLDLSVRRHWRDASEDGIDNCLGVLVTEGCPRHSRSAPPPT